MNTQPRSTEMAANELSNVVPQFAQMLAEAMHADRCAIFAYAEDQQSTIALFRFGYDDEIRAAHSRTNPFNPNQIPAEAQVIRTMQPFMRSSEEDFARFPLVNPGQERLEGRLTDLVVPLVWDDRVQGVAYIWRPHNPEPYTSSEIETAAGLGQLIAMTIVFSRQYESERMQRLRLDTLLEVASVASSGQHLDDVLQALAAAVRTSTSADVCSLYILNERGDEVITAYEDGLLPHEVNVFIASQKISALDVPVEVRVRRTLEPDVIRDFKRELAVDSPLTEYLQSNGIAEMLVLPITWQQRVAGSIYCWYRSAERQFSQTSIETAKGVAQQAGGVVTRAQLKETIHQQAEESEALLRIGQAVLTSETLTPVLDEISGSLQHLIPFDYCYVGTLTADERSIRVIREWGTNYESILNALIPVDASLSGTAIRERRLVATEHKTSDPRAWQHIPTHQPLQAIAVAPLIHHNQNIGVIFIARESSQPFYPREERLLTLLSQHAAIAIERVQSREDLARRTQRQELLARVGELLVTSDNPEHSLQQIAEFSSGVIADGIAIGLSGWEYGAIRWVADSFDDPELDEVLHQGLSRLDMNALRERLEHVLVSNQEFSFPVERIWSEHRFLQDFAESLGVRHMLAIPFYQQERAPGIMVLFSRNEQSSFREEEVDLARIIAQRIGVALERQQVKRNHEGLLRVSEALYGPDDLHALIRTIAGELSQLLPCDQLVIAELDRENGSLVTQVFLNHGQEDPVLASLNGGEGLSGEALRSRQAIMEQQADLHSSTIYRNDTDRERYAREGESVLVTPLIVEGEPIGILFMNRTGHFRFTMADYETFLLFAGLAGAALDRTTLEQHNRELYRASTEVLAAVVDAKDPTTLEHSRHVAYYSRELATLMNLPTDEIERIELAGLLHDIGKLGIPDRILQKPGKLTDEEFAVIKTHPDRGARILERHPALGQLIPLVRHHHEAWDGRGYPQGLKGDETPLGASIICIADAFDTITSVRTYQVRRSVDAALEELERCAGTQFHPVLVRRFIDHLNADRSLVFSKTI